MWFITLMKYLTMALCVIAIIVIVYRILSGKIKNDEITPRMKIFFFIMLAVILFLIFLRIYDSLS
jgi:hypothetical protein